MKRLLLLSMPATFAGSRSPKLHSAHVRGVSAERLRHTGDVRPHVFQVDGSLRRWDVPHQLSELVLPVLVTCGRYDEVTPEIARELADGIPGAELRVFENSSHVPHIEEPEPYLAAIEGFLISIEGR